MRRVIYVFSMVLLLAGCGRDGHFYDSIISFVWFGEIMDVTSKGTESGIYDIEVRRSPSEFIKNPPESAKLLIVSEETTAIEGEDFLLSTNNIVFAKGERITSFRLTIMPVTTMKTLTLKLDYTHPQMSFAKLPSGEEFESPAHFARFHILSDTYD